VAFTTPKTWSFGEILTSTDMNVYVRDNTDELFTRDTNASLLTSGTLPAARLPNHSANLLTTGTVATGRLPAGTVLQVVQTEKTDSYSTTSNTIADVTGVSVSITPGFTSSKVLVTITGVYTVSTDASPNNAIQRFYLTNAGNTVLSQGESRGSRARATFGRVGGGDGRAGTISISFLHSPNSTSAQTYKLRAAVSGSYILAVGRTDTADDDTGFNILTPTTITAMEVRG